MIYCLKENEVNLYRVSHPGVVDGGKEVVQWAGRQADVVAIKKEWIESGIKRKQISTEEIEVPTKKDELVAWLTEHEV